MRNVDRVFDTGYGYQNDVGDSGVREPEEFVEANGDQIMATWVESNRALLDDEMSFEPTESKKGMARVYEIAWDIPTMHVDEIRRYTVKGTDGEHVTSYIRRTR
jgi:hypothetical protein